MIYAQSNVCGLLFRIFIFFISSIYLLSGCATQSQTQYPEQQSESDPGQQDEPHIQIPSQPITIPALVQVPPAKFIQGDQNLSGDLDERPARFVEINYSFMVGIREVTFNEFQEFTQDSVVNMPTNEGWGIGDHPVINVSWDDAIAYTKWLSSRTGRKFRLPSESEWEYVAASGVVTNYLGGNDPASACRYANIADLSAKAVYQEWTVTDCSDGAVHTSIVGSYLPNAFGLYDVMGNVWEWTLDCYKATYKDTPLDGGPVLQTSCDGRVVRGGSYKLPAEQSRLRNRLQLPSQTKSNQIGFRIVEEL